MKHRLLEQSVAKDFGKGKVIILLGPRQVGKTTLLDQLDMDKKQTLFLNCDDFDDRLLLEDKTKVELRSLVDGYKNVFIDEAQRVKSIGLIIKMLADLHLDCNIVATGSSSMELAEGIFETATGRVYEYKMFPFSLVELANDTNEREQKKLLEQRMIYGLYPEVVNNPSDAKRTLSSLVNSYLYKDILAYKGLKKPDVLQKLVVALALQVGNEVSYNELSNLLGIDKETVENYINLLEKCFVVFRLNSFNKNLRTELKKGKKIYFYDNGIRNAVISNFAPLELRSDSGALWENLMVSERMKRNAYVQSYAQTFFWRTVSQKEIDLVEWKEGRLQAFEFKWREDKKVLPPKEFASTYLDASYEVITPSNFWSFLK